MLNWMGSLDNLHMSLKAFSGILLLYIYTHHHRQIIYIYIYIYTHAALEWNIIWKCLSFDREDEKEDRFFVEAGAFDGEVISNSLLFETQLGWSGLLIEPNPIAFDRLLTKHRKAWSINACLSTKPYPQTIQFDVDGICGGIIKNGVEPGQLQVQSLI